MPFDIWIVSSLGGIVNQSATLDIPWHHIPIGGIACLNFLDLLVIGCKCHNSPSGSICLSVNFDFILVAITEQSFKGVELFLGS